MYLRRNGENVSKAKELNLVIYFPKEKYFTFEKLLYACNNFTTYQNVINRNI